MPRVNEAFFKKNSDNSEQKIGIAAWLYKVMFIGNGSRFGFARVDHDKLTTALLNRLQPIFHIGHRHQAAIGRQGVTANNQHVIGVIDIGYGD